MVNSIRKYPGYTALFATVIAYITVIGTLYSDFFGVIYPRIDLGTVNLLSDLIAINNTLATICLILGWVWIRNGDVKKHPWAMITAFLLIILFLVMYLLKTGGGGRKEFIGPVVAKRWYLIMLGTHIVLSIVSVPVVLYTLILGLSRPIPEIRSSVHAKMGRFAAGAWILSLILGIVAYIILNHVYTFEFVPA